MSQTSEQTDEVTRNKEYLLPSLQLLTSGDEYNCENPETIAVVMGKFQRTLDCLGIDGRIADCSSGPRVIRIEVTLNPGVNATHVEKILGNVAMSMGARNIRIPKVLPDSSTVTLEIPRTGQSTVFLHSIMESEAWRTSMAEIPIALGRNASGKPVVFDLAKAPHMLIAGSTGSGKSMCVNSLIMSLLFRFSPEELKLIMVDTKVTETEDYRTLPHLLMPIINTSSEGLGMLRRAVSEIMRRYQLFDKAGVRKLSEYNSRNIPDAPELDDEGNPLPRTMPREVIIIDDFADLMMSGDREEVEKAVCSIGMKGRAAGIHIIIVTQRMDKSVITGNIKAFLPAKLCFHIYGSKWSKAVLGVKGAEKLFEYGDMLYMSPGNTNPERIHGAFISGNDIIRVVKFVTSKTAPDVDTLPELTE